jgi:hypothetical protein
MRPSDELVNWLLGIAEGVAAYGDHVDTLAGERLAQAAREAVDEYWEQVGDYPDSARQHRDEVFGLLLNTQPHDTLH